MSEIPAPVSDLVVIGKVVSMYGIRSEVKVYPFTDPLDNLLDYRRWTLQCDGEVRQAELVRGRLHGKVLAAKLRGFDDREKIRTLTGCEICTPHNELPSLEEGEYYWHQLESPKVIDQGEQLLGVIGHLLETSANDVMVVRPCAGSLNSRGRLLPYAEQCVLSIDLAAGEMRVDWGAGF